MSYSITPATGQTVSEGAGALSFTISRSDSLLAETLYVSTAPNLGFANTSDYQGLLNQALSFAIGETTKTITITINDDTTVETNETFGIILQKLTSDPVGTYLARSSFTIIDNDLAPPSSYAISPDAASVSEGAGTLTFTVTRAASTVAETVYVSTTPNMGFSNSGDYTGLLDQPVSFAAGQTSATISIRITDDTTVETNETFGIIVQRSTADPVSTSLSRTSFTILDNDTVKPPPGPVALAVYPATGIDSIGQGNRDNDDSHVPGSARQWAYDFLTQNFTDVHAVSGGTAVAIRQNLSGSFRGYGNVITILSDDGYYTTYGHLTAFSSSLQLNQHVDAGQIIAKSGDSGSYDGTVLHPNLHIQFGSRVTLFNAKAGDSSTAALIANGADDTMAPAYFPKLTIDYAHRADTGLSSDTDYSGAAGIDDFTGNGYANTVFGAGGNDILRGMNGNDTLQGGTGGDTLSGGSGNDRFAYYALNEVGDTILDYANAADRFEFKGTEFGGLAAGLLQASQFQSLQSSAAVVAGDRFIFNTVDTTLWFDPDGNGALAAVMVADLQAGAKLTYDGIVIV